MKKYLRLYSVMLIVITVFVSCDKDEMDEATLKGISYTTTKVSGKLKTAFASKEAVINPKDAKVTFSISKVTKDAKTAKKDGFKIDLKGKVYAAKDHEIAEGTYKVTVQAQDKSDSDNKKTAILTVEIKE